MKPVLRFFLLLNAVLFGVLILVLLNRHHGPASPPAMLSAAPKSQTTARRALTSQRARATFHWSQLESPDDYRGYIANLRAIGCPERTIRAIAAADVHLAFARQRQQAGVNPGDTNSFFFRAESKAVASLLEAPPPAVAHASLAPGGTYSRARPMSGESTGQLTVFDRSEDAQRALAAYPMVFQVVNTDAQGLSASQQEVIQQLQQQFVAAIGGMNQNPSDPAYLDRWQKAQKESDDTLRARLGDQWYVGQQLKKYYEDFSKALLQAQQPSL